MNTAAPGDPDKVHVTTTFFLPDRAVPRLQVEASPQRLSRLPPWPTADSHGSLQRWSLAAMPSGA
jgi:hypothetical protein